MTEQFAVVVVPHLVGALGGREVFGGGDLSFEKFLSTVDSVAEFFQELVTRDRQFRRPLRFLGWTPGPGHLALTPGRFSVTPHATTVTAVGQGSASDVAFDPPVRVVFRRSAGLAGTEAAGRTVIYGSPALGGRGGSSTADPGGFPGGGIDA